MLVQNNITYLKKLNFCQMVGRWSNLDLVWFWLFCCGLMDLLLNVSCGKDVEPPLLEFYKNYLILGCLGFFLVTHPWAVSWQFFFLLLIIFDFKGKVFKVGMVHKLSASPPLCWIFIQTFLKCPSLNNHFKTLNVATFRKSMITEPHMGSLTSKGISCWGWGRITPWKKSLLLKACMWRGSKSPTVHLIR